MAGHRENTIGSMLAALKVGVDWLEADVTRTRDDTLVVRHNPTVEDGRFLVDLTRAEAAEAGVVALDELFDALPAGAPVDLDVKSVLEDAVDPAGRRTAALLAPVLARELARRPLLVTSFDPSVLLALREQVPGAAYGLIAWVDFPLRHAVAAAAGLGLDVVALHDASFGPNRIEPGPVHRAPATSVGVAHQAGLEVLAWCPTAEAAGPLVAAGVDALCLNDVPAAVPAARAGW